MFCLVIDGSVLRLILNHLALLFFFWLWEAEKEKSKEKKDQEKRRKGAQRKIERKEERPSKLKNIPEQ